MDQIDILSGLKPGSALYDIRRERPDFVDGTELCRTTVLTPNHGFGIGRAMRAALAARMARLIGHADLAATYDRMIEEAERDMAGGASTSGDTAGNKAALAAIATGADIPEAVDAFIRGLVRHADLVTRTPRNSTRADIACLEEAGLSNPQIIALSELIAFVNYEARVIVGLSILETVE